jgi:hypothetical protein
VISNTAQWPKEKNDKMTNSDQQYSTMAKGKKGENDKQWSAIQHNDKRKERTK